MTWVVFYLPAPPGRPAPVPAAQRTRSPRWRAGTRRTRKLCRQAHVRGLPLPATGPWARYWHDIGYTTDDD